MLCMGIRYIIYRYIVFSDTLSSRVYPLNLYGERFYKLCFVIDFIKKKFTALIIRGTFQKFLLYLLSNNLSNIYCMHFKFY